eukprot:TRINITY_DN1354_c0_g1_i5.p1 TRINITY_DN1354_c0_g1~~TRINITY_DN1354_c0_g1_i5.p1  ORF type:complete len:1725 (+),score=486.77 TRINITY_DN1354_c0_g1_i5:4690-9864(+)
MMMRAVCGVVGLLLPWCFASSQLPACNPDPFECLKSIDPVFADAVGLRFEGKFEKVRESPSLRGAFCNHDNWRRRSEVCGQCAYTLHITQPPGLEGNPICLQDYTSHPYNASSHMHSGHPLNGEELDIKTHTGTGCEPEDWPDLTNSVAYASLRGCRGPEVPTQKGARIAAFGISFGTGVQRLYGNHLRVFEADHWADVANGGDTLLFYGLLDSFGVLERAFSSVDNTSESSVRGKVVYNCNFDARTRPEKVDLSSYYDDGCPWWFMQTYDMCSDMPNAAEQLCSVCPLEMYSEKGNTEALGCLYAPDLTPSRRDLFLHAVGEGRSSEESVVYIPGLMGELCTGFDSLPAALWGKVVATDAHGCNVHEFLKKMSPFSEGTGAPRGGARLKGLIGVGDDRPNGWASNISIPTAWTANTAEKSRILSHFHLGNHATVGFRIANGSTITLRAYEVSVYLQRNTVNASDTTEAPAGSDDAACDLPEDESGRTVFSQKGVVASLVLLPFLALAIITKAAMDWNVERSRPGRVDEPGMSITWSSTALSLSLVVVVAGLAFGLSFDAGQQAVRTQSDHGERALNFANERNVQNVETLSMQVMHMLLQSSTSAYSKWRVEAIQISDSIAGFVRQETVPNYGEFRSQRANIARTLRYHPDRGVDWMKWGVQVYSSNGFYYDTFWNTNRPSHKDLGDMPLNETNPLPYGFYRGDPFGSIFTSFLPPGQPNVTQFIKTFDESSDGIVTRAGLIYFTPTQRETSSLRSRSMNGGFPLGPCYTFLQPMMPPPGKPQVMIGLVTMSLPASQLSHEILLSMHNHMVKTPLVANMSFFFLDADGNIMVSLEDDYSIVDTLDGYDRDVAGSHTYTLPTVHNTRCTHVAALASKLYDLYGMLVPPESAVPSGEIQTITFNERDYYKNEVPSVVMRLALDDGLLADATPNAWDTDLFFHSDPINNVFPDVKITGASTAALFGEDRNGISRSALQLNGSTYLKVYPYLTMRVPRIKAKLNDSVVLQEDEVYRNRCTWEGLDDVLCYNDRPILRESVTYRVPYSVSMFVRSGLDGVSQSYNLHTAELFTDSLSPSASVRLYANGRLVISVLKNACTTPPLLDLPDMKWYHITASVNFKRGVCAVFVNGLERGRGAFSLNYDLPFSHEGFFLGRGFRGSIDDFRMHNRSMGEADIQLMMSTSGARSIYVPKKSWTVAALPIQGLTGLEQTMHTVMVPTEDIVRDVAAHTQRINMVTQVHRKNTESHLLRKSVETVLVTCVILLVATLVFLIFNEMLTKPFVAFAHDINQIAMMELDEVEVEWDSSMLYEINMMSRAMKVLIRNMREYKDFMPMSVVGCLGKGKATGSTPTLTPTTASGSAPSDTAGPPTDDSTADDGSVSLNLNSSKGSFTDMQMPQAEVELNVPTSASPRNRARGAQRRTLTGESSGSAGPIGASGGAVRRSGGRASSRARYSGKKKMAQSAAVLLSASLHKRRMSFVVVNIVGFHDLCCEMADQAIINTHSDYIKQVADTCLRHKGIPDTFSGDRVLLTYNGIKHCTSHEGFAALTALRLSCLWQQTQVLKLSMSVVSGGVRAGHIGAVKMRRYCMIGPVVPWAFALERYCRGEGQAILANTRVVEQSTGQLRFKHYNVLSYPKLGDKLQLVSRVVGQVDPDTDWLYITDPTNDPNTAWNDFFRVLASERRPDTEDSLRARIPEALACAETEADRLLLQSVEDGTYRPVQLSYC